MSANQSAKDLAEFLVKNGLHGVRVEGDIIGYPLSNSRFILLKVIATDYPDDPAQTLHNMIRGVE